MKKNTKKKSWLYYFYKENVMYIWIVIGIVVVSGFSIGMSIGKLTDNNLINEGNSNNQIAFNENSNNFKTITDISKKVDENSEVNLNEDSGKDVEIENSNSTSKTHVKQKDDKQSSVQVASTNIQKKEEKKVEKLEFIMPVEGDVMRDYTKDTLVFSNTLQQWVSHEAVDILSQIASPVKAIEAGKVIEVKSDPRYGYIIILEHGQGYQSVYCNLSTLDMVHVGKEVEKGQVISGIGNTALYEIKDNPHLHFELMKDGKNVNPLEHIK